MSLVAIVFSRCRLIALGAFFLVAPMANVSQAVTVAADTFTRADTGSGGANDLGNTEVGDFAWGEFFIQNPFGDPGVAEIINGELKVTGGWSTAFIDVGLSDLTASADLHFSGVGVGDPQTSYMVGFVLRVSDPEVVPLFNPEENQGIVFAFVLSTGGMMIGENRYPTSYQWYYIDNPFNEGEVAFNGFGDPGSLPTTINGAPYDANGNGRLDDDEPFHFAAVLAGTNIDLQINGETIKSATLENTSGFSANGFALTRQHVGGSFEHFPHFDNLIIDGDGPTPSDLNMDGFVDGLDLGILLGNWNTTTTPEMGELNGIPPVDGLDLGILLGAWNPSPLAVAGAVPEPSTLALLSLALGAVSLRRSRS